MPPFYFRKEGIHIMAERIGTIKLNSGQGGFFDELTNIHLTAANPLAHLYAGQNLTNIRKGIGVGHLILTNGTLGPDPRPYRLVRVGNHLEITLKPQALKKKAAKKVDVVLKEEQKADAAPEKAKGAAEDKAVKAKAAEKAKDEKAKTDTKEEKKDVKKDKKDAVEDKKATEENSAKKATTKSTAAKKATTKKADAE